MSYLRKFSLEFWSRDDFVKLNRASLKSRRTRWRENERLGMHWSDFFTPDTITRVYILADAWYKTDTTVKLISWIPCHVDDTEGISHDLNIAFLSLQYFPRIDFTWVSCPSIFGQPYFCYILERTTPSKINYLEDNFPWFAAPVPVCSAVMRSREEREGNRD